MAEKVEEESRPLLGGQQPSSSGAVPLPQETVLRPKRSIWRQVFLGVVVALPSVAPGMSFGFSAVSTDQLRLTVDQESWFASMTAMGYPLGSLVVGPMMDRFGRRPALLSINLVSLIGWLLLAVHTARPTMLKLLTGRVLTGVAGGLASIPAAVYAGEVLGPSLSFRASLVTWSTVALSAGIFLVYSTGTFIPYYGVASIATLISIGSFIMVAIFIPESPAWLSARGRHGDAGWSQKELDIASSDGSSETPPETSQETPAEPPAAPPPTTWRELTRPEAYKPILIMTGFFFFQQFSGVFVMIAYMVDVVRYAGVVTVNAYTVAFIGGTIILVVSVLAAALYPNTGVRSVAALSGAGTAATMLFTGAFLELRTLWWSTPELYFLNWVPFFAILANIAISTLGFLILPWSMLGEVFPLHVKGLAAGIATSLGFVFSFIAAKCFPYLLYAFGTGGMFLFFGVMALLGTIYVVIFLPETRGKTLEEILNGFSSRSATH